jgi:hypothetical protein
MRTAGMLEAEWSQVLQGSVSTTAKEDESSTGRIWAAGFRHVTARSRLERFETYEPCISSIFNFFFGLRYTADIESVDTGARLYNQR